jgi:hypothetical protein
MMNFLKRVSLTPKMKAARKKIREAEAQRRKAGQLYKSTQRTEARRLSASIKKSKKKKR